MLLLRFQDGDGVGPFAAADHGALAHDRVRPPKMPDAALAKLRGDAPDPGHHAFAAVGWDGLRAWFSPDEMQRLAKAGFRLVDVSRAHVIARDETQAVVCSRFPFRMYPDARQEG